MFKLLQDRADVPAGEDVSGQQQHWNAINRGRGRACHHVRRARPDGTDAGESAQAITHLRKGRCDMHRGLLILRLVIAELRILLECLADARDATVTEDAHTPGEERLTLSVALNMLVKEESNQSLSGS